MIALATLIDDLKADVPVENNVPSDEQFEKAIMRAVEDFSRRAGRIKRATLAIVSGTATYELPADFIKMINLVSLYSLGGVINSPSGLIPFSGDFTEEYVVNNGQITFYPTPSYSMEREYRYKAGWALTVDSGGDYYEDLGDAEAAIALKYALALVLKNKADALGGGFSYRQGDVQVDTGTQAESLRKDQDAARADYLAAVETYVGTVLVMG
jgi:hypothetical protein